jgi:hypothetical protein
MSIVALDHSIEISNEVELLAEQLGVRSELPAVVAMTRVVFPDAVVTVETEHDPEIAGYSKLVIVVTQVRQDVPSAVAAHQRWHRELPESCQPSLASNFCLGMEFDE